jgi:peptidoglycan/xylan/chitin deacetylase (PgdA/CDA1 family)
MSLKGRIASVLDAAGIASLFFRLSMLLYGKHIRVINYHGTPEEEMKNFEAQLAFYKRHYSDVSAEDLEVFLFQKTWTKSKPGLIISFDDGYRSNYDHAVPLLEKYGFTGWFFIPSGLIESSKEEQSEFAGKKRSKLAATYTDGRFLMSWEEIRKLGDRHVVGCHTFSHHRMNRADGDELLTKEIVFSKQLLEEKSGRPVNTFCWVGGEEHTYARSAADKIRSAGYRFSFMTNTYPLTMDQDPLQIQRTNIESDNPLSLVRFQLSPLMDLLYYKKRKRINRMTI